MLTIGSKAPTFNLDGSGGGKVSLASLKGHFAVIVFYPRNNTPGCNRQLTGLEQARPEFEKLNTLVLAINPADIKSHQNYCEKKGFKFPILSDPERLTLTRYKALKDDGQKVQRSVYAVDPDGKIIFAQQGQADYKEIMELIKSRM
ncbi:MAG TPA: peroxiredoxin family protein [candidate division Zixibacteria bacterium]|nr:peroxiredoxin family protein [candidate division Zixibacteria bacterium]